MSAKSRFALFESRREILENGTPALATGTSDSGHSSLGNEVGSASIQSQSGGFPIGATVCIKGYSGTFSISNREPDHYIVENEGGGRMRADRSIVFANHLQGFYWGEIVKYKSVRSTSQHQYKIVGLYPESGNAEIRHLVTGEMYVTSLNKLCKV